MAITFDNTVFGAAQASTGVYALGAFTGTNTLSGAAPVTVNGTIGNPGSTVSVNLNIAGVSTVGAQGTYLGYSAIPNSTNYVYYLNVTGANLVTPVQIAVTGAPALPALNVATTVTASNVTAPGVSPTCFATGTHIRTTRGEIAVESLVLGDEVVTATGAHRPITWIGRRRTDCAAAFNPVEVLPIRIRAGAFGPNMPIADLVVSPGHRLFVNGGLVHADKLVNGWSITRDQVDEITYWHVELESHDILLAEGLPAESYLDCGNRASFDNGGSLILMQPDLDMPGQEEGRCAPLIGEEALAAIKQWLLVRAAAFGARLTDDPGFTLAADGLRLTPIGVAGERFRFAVPAGTERLEIVSRSAVPAEVEAASDDRRRLGVFISRLMIDGAAVPLEGATFAKGWNDAEEIDGFSGRWTKGAASLPCGRDMSFSIVKLPHYAIDAADAPASRLADRDRPAQRLHAVG